MKIFRFIYKKCNPDYACGTGRMVKGICDVCGDAYYEATPPRLPLCMKIWTTIIPRIIVICYSRIKWKIKLRKDFYRPKKRGGCDKTC